MWHCKSKKYTLRDGAICYLLLPSVHCFSASRSLCSSYHVTHWWLILWYVWVAKRTAYNHSVAGSWRQCTSYLPVCIYMTLLGASSRKSSDVSYCRYVLWVGRTLKHFTERGREGWEGGLREREREGMTEETSRPWENVSNQNKLVAADCRKWDFNSSLLLFLRNLVEMLFEGITESSYNGLGKPHRQT